jgi:hypothetical protein
MAQDRPMVQGLMSTVDVVSKWLSSKCSALVPQPPVQRLLGAA